MHRDCELTRDGSLSIASARSIAVLSIDSMFMVIDIIIHITAAAQVRQTTHGDGVDDVLDVILECATVHNWYVNLVLVVVLQHHMKKTIETSSRL